MNLKITEIQTFLVSAAPPEEGGVGSAELVVCEGVDG